MISGGAASETGISRALWKAIMKRVHENLPKQDFSKPEGIVQVAVCSRSGRLPIPGLCDAEGCVITEYFAEGTEPTESCNVHFEGVYCNHDLLPATPDCPFKVEGRITLPLPEEPALISGSTMIIENPDGTQSISTPITATHCQHDEAFFANPDYEAILNIHQLEIHQRNEAAAAAAEAAGQ